MLREILKEKQVLLASKSPRRQYLLKELGIDFKVIDLGDVDEIYPEHLSVEEIPLYLSELKAKAYSENLNENDLLITSDTIVIHQDKVLGKPVNFNNAKEMLISLSNSSHDVITGVTLRSQAKIHSFSSKTKVFFKPLKEEEIIYYINNYMPFDKAGAYGIQEWIGYIGVEKIEGSYFNVMGLPIQKLYCELINFIK